MTSRGLLDLIICRIPGLSVRERVTLCTKFEKEDEIAILFREDIEKILGRPVSRRPWTMDAVRREAEKDAAAARMRGMTWVSCVSPGYPPLVREIYDPPAVLFYRGKLPDPGRPAVAVVGTRRPSPGAAAAAFDMARYLGRRGIPVVSGLALGIDAMAHRGNLEGGVPGAAVLGSGVDEIYPASNRPLARRILEAGGALISEYPPGTPPRPWRFPARNRIISALARGTVIVQAPEKSGALLTAAFALEQGRDLWVAAAGLDSAGTAKLAADGAGVLHSACSILREWNMDGGAEDGGDTAVHPDGADIPRREFPGGKDLAFSLARALDIEIEGT
ncbi:MAG: DNA-processing protein DprA [Treponema sp.]|jgi:DNA processing protein|nr:DNA-processing protein DprA [Treponema sp.]